jgi:hypothetical protein
MCRCLLNCLCSATRIRPGSTGGGRASRLSTTTLTRSARLALISFSGRWRIKPLWTGHRSGAKCASGLGFLCGNRTNPSRPRKKVALSLRAPFRRPIYTGRNSRSRLGAGVRQDSSADISDPASTSPGFSHTDITAHAMSHFRLSLRLVEEMPLRADRRQCRRGRRRGAAGSGGRDLCHGRQLAQPPFVLRPDIAPAGRIGASRRARASVGMPRSA